MNQKGKQFIDHFYEIFLGKSDEIKKAFDNTDVKKQKDMLKKSIVHLVNFFVTKKASDFMQSLAKRHQHQLKISTSMYDTWLRSLLEALDKIDLRNNDIRKLSWRITMAPGIEFMKHDPPFIVDQGVSFNPPHTVTCWIASHIDKIDDQADTYKYQTRPHPNTESIIQAHRER